MQDFVNEPNRFRLANHTYPPSKTDAMPLGILKQLEVLAQNHCATLGSLIASTLPKWQ